MDFDLRSHTHLLAIAGSRAYGTHRPESDVDVKGVAVPPRHWIYSFYLDFAQADSPDRLETFEDLLTETEASAVATSKLEGVVYGVRKFCRLAADANPNILDVLFCREQELRLVTPVGRRLREQRALFVNAKARFTFAGYATAQLKRIRTHRRWILHPPSRKPTREDFGLPPMPLMPRNQREAAEAAVKKKIDGWNVDYGPLAHAEKIRIEAEISAWLSEVGLGLSAADAQWLAAARHVGLDDNLLEVLRDERRYDGAMAEFKRYRTWQRSRNPARAALEAKHHYDTKHGSHLVRLLRMGEEILTTGQVHVWRGADGGPGDAEELLAIRDGAWPYEQLMAWAEAQEATLKQVYDSGQYSIPDAPDRQAIDALCVELMELALS